ncbi:hypothetical protein BdWA1_001223 [Babesia duncani]|uniref:Uncharacterized protein n=1 Tax=Babesia duncani TaxID=323732 RepID=A0AAD9PNW3_9APIC|nr:hypothetical protein BdWA1_001223 [Babesia duncani]
MSSNSIVSDSTPSIILDQGYFSIDVKEIVDCMNGKPLVYPAGCCNIAVGSNLDISNFKILVICAYNACKQHKFMVANRIISAIFACTLNSYEIAKILNHGDIQIFAGLLFIIYKTKDWIRLSHCLSLMATCSAILSHCKVCDLKSIRHQRIIKNLFKAIQKNRKQIDENGANDIQAIRHEFDLEYTLRNFVLLLLKNNVDLVRTMGPYLNGDDLFLRAVVAVSSQRIYGTDTTHIMYNTTLHSKCKRWRHCELIISFNNDKDHHVVMDMPLVTCTDIKENGDNYTNTDNMNTSVALGFHCDLAKCYKFTLVCKFTWAQDNEDLNRNLFQYYKSILDDKAMYKVEQPPKLEKMSIATIEVITIDIYLTLQIEQVLPEYLAMGRKSPINQKASEETSAKSVDTFQTLEHLNLVLRRQQQQQHVPRSIGKISNTCATESPSWGENLPCDTLPSQIKGIQDKSFMLKVFPKMSLAIVQLQGDHSFRISSLPQQASGSLIGLKEDVTTPSPCQAVTVLGRRIKRQRRIRKCLSRHCKQSQTKSGGRFRHDNNTKSKNSLKEHFSPIPRRLYTGRSSRYYRGWDFSCSVYKPAETRALEYALLIKSHLSKARMLMKHQREWQRRMIRHDFSRCTSNIERRLVLVLSRSAARWRNLNSGYLAQIHSLPGC